MQSTCFYQCKPSGHCCTSADSFPPEAVRKKKSTVNRHPAVKHQQLKACRAAAAGRTRGWGELKVWPSSPGCRPPGMAASLSASGTQLQWRKSVTRRRCSGPELHRPVWTETKMRHQVQQGGKIKCLTGGSKRLNMLLLE